VAAGDEVQQGAIGELAQEEGVSIWGMGRREAHRRQRVMAAHLGRRWTSVTESSGGLCGQLEARGGAPRRRGPGGDVSGPGNDWWRPASERRSQQMKSSASATLASQWPMA
jgi:hypothetical protein